MTISLSGKFTTILRRDGEEIGHHEARNMIVDGGVDRVVDWLKTDLYSSNTYPGLKQIDTTGMTLAQNNFANPSNAVDGSSSSYAYGTINNTSWDVNYWQIAFGAQKNLMALRVEWMESDSDYGCDYKFQTSTNGTAWTDLPTRLRPPQEASQRGKALWFVSDAPPLAPIACNYVRLNTKKRGTDKYLSMYEVSFFEPNFVPQPPLMIKIGDGTASPSGVQTDLSGSTTLSKKVIMVAEPSSNKARLVATLSGAEGNGVTFSEAGVFCSPSGHINPLAAECTIMFSRALYGTPWSKSEGVTADLYYEIEVLNS
jgi:hypothetical protein